jgi:hypothetical protein
MDSTAVAERLSLRLLLHPQVASEAAARLGPAVSALFSASTFLKFERDAAGEISLPLLQQYLARRVANARLVSLATEQN